MSVDHVTLHLPRGHCSMMAEGEDMANDKIRFVHRRKGVFCRRSSWRKKMTPMRFLKQPEKSGKGACLTEIPLTG